jgi:NADH-quinone oxidoreductase subunit E
MSVARFQEVRGMVASTDPSSTARKLPPELFARLDEAIDALNVDPTDPRRAQTLSQTLRTAQMIFGHLPQEVQLHVAHRYRISHAVVSGVISFYNFFTTTPKGKTQVSVCMGTACYVNGADKVLHECERVLGISAGEVTEDGQFSLESLRCLGVCGLAPVVTVNEKVHGDVRPHKVRELLDKDLTEAYGE